MRHCSVCNQDVVAKPPNDAYWAVVGSFWAISLAFGFGMVASRGWSFLLLVTWALFAITAGVLVQHAISWSCAECGAAMPDPFEADPARTPRSARRGPFASR